MIAFVALRTLRWGVWGLVCAFLLTGAYGTWSYVHDYEVYRGFPVPTDPPGIPQGHIAKVVFRSRALHQRRYYLLYTPPCYAAAAARGERFPVLYLLHAPPGRPEHYFQAGALAVRMDELIAGRRIRPFLVALPYGRTGAFGSDTEWADARAGRFEGLVLDTARAVDARWSTVRNRRGRAIAGLSEGGYAAANIALRNLRTFGLFESWSGYYDQTPTGVFSGLPRRVVDANSPELQARSPRVAAAIRRLGLHAFVYQGQADDVSIPAMLAFAARLRGDGAVVQAAVYRGKHNWRLWRAHFDQMLAYADGSFAGGVPRC